MMATAGPPSTSGFLPLLESLEDSTTGQTEQTDAYLTIANRLSGEEGRQFLPAVEKHFSRLGEAILTHVTSTNAELSQAALQTLGFCVYHSHVVSTVPETFVAETLSALCSLVVKSTDKNTCTRALWVISKQSFTPDVVAKKVSSILGALESVWSREDIQSVVMEHEALNVVIRLLEQVPAQMGEEAVRWAKLVIPLVIHSASKVRLRAAAAMEMGMPLLLKKQTEVAAIIEPIMSSKLIPELQKLFMSKNETNVLKLWPLFVKLLGKLLHRGGPFINSLLHLEELGFRSSSPTIKKIAFIAWKSLIDNFALNPDILSSAKRMKLLMQPLTSIHVRTEALMLTKVEVWWYLVVQLGPNLSPNFDQVSVPLLQCTIGSNCPFVPGTPSRTPSQNGAAAPGTPKTGAPGFSSPANTSRMSLNSSIQVPSTFPCIQLLGLEMLLHYFLGPEAVAVATKNKLILSLEPLKHPLLSGASSFTKHAAVLTSSIRDGFTNIGKDAPDSLLAVTWSSLARFVNLTIESVGSKKDRQGCEVLTLMLQALQSIVTSEALPAARVLTLFEATVKCIPQRVLSSASYQVGKMDVLNGTPALFLILLLYKSSLLPAYTEDERFFQCLQTLVGCGLSGPTSPLAFAEAVLGAIKTSAGSLQNKEQLWRMWSVMVSSLTDTITQSNEVNQGDALEHNFSAVHSALLFPVTHLLHGVQLQQASQKSMLVSWSKLYKVFARCSALVATAEENICCEEFCAKMAASIDTEAVKVPSTLNAVASILQVMIECVDFSPYTPQFQQKLKSPHTPVNWMKKRNRALGNLFTFQALLVQCLEVYLEAPDCLATGAALASVLSTLFTNLILANAVQEVLTALIQPLTLFYKHAGADPPKIPSQLLTKLEKLLSEILSCLQSRCALAYNDDLLALLSPLLCVLFPHKSKLVRASVTQFWNATFANSVSLTYPDELRPILSQVKQKTPIILPGFEAVAVSDELSGQYSSESSQMETKLSGMPVSSVGKRDSLLGKAAEPNDRSATKASKPVSTKLDFGSPKPPRREVLEEEASIDFVFIPPEMKQRVLTEHQKEVKRTKRVDIPAMYNNLDASLDTTVFSQYTQSQEDSVDKVPTEQADKVTEDASGKVPQQVTENENPDVLTKDTQDYASPKPAESILVDPHQEEMVPRSTDVSMEVETKREKAECLVKKDSQERTSPNMSSDLVSGTPQKPNSRRQSFITLEKYAEGKPASPSSASTFTGPLAKTSTSQERSETSKTPSSQTSAHSQDCQSSPKVIISSQHLVTDATESPRRPKDCGMKSEPVRLFERLHCDTTEDDDVIPDTQTEVESKESTEEAEEMKPSSQEEESDSALDDSQSTQSEPRRSGRHRVRPLLPGEKPEEREEKYTNCKRRRSGSEQKNDSPVQSRPNTRSKLAAEEDSGRERLRSRAQRDKGESSKSPSESRALKKIRLHKSPESFPNKPQAKRRSTRESSQTDLLSDSQSDYESQSQGRRGRQSKTSAELKEEVTLKKKVLPEKGESSQTSTPEVEKDKVLKKGSQTNTSPQSVEKSQEVELIEQIETDNELIDSQIITTSPLRTSQEVEQTQILMTSPQKVKTESRDAQLVTSSPTKQESQDRTNTPSESVNEELVKDKPKTQVMESLSQEDSQVTASPSDGQSLRRSRRSKASSETESGDGKDSNSQTETRVGGRTRSGKVGEELSKRSPSTESSQSQDAAGSESSLGRGRYSRRRSLVANVDTSESDSSESVPTRRGRKTRASLQSPLTVEPKDKSNVDEANDSQKEETQSLETANADLDGSQKGQDRQGPAAAGNAEQQGSEESPMDKETDAVVAPEKMEMHDRKEHAEEQRQKDTDDISSVESEDGEDLHESAGISNEPIQNKLPCEAVASEKLQISETAEERSEDCSKTGEQMEAEGNQKEEPDQQEPAVIQVDDVVQDQPESLSVIEAFSEDRQPSASDRCAEKPSTALQEDTDDEPQPLEDQDQEEVKTDGVESSIITLLASVSAESAHTEDFQDSPMKQKDLDAVMGPDVGQSPVSSRTRGTWSPSASPSTSILKKGQKRMLEEESPSPLVKSRRVSFADPIQQQETADDIDRRSPAVRTSSPRRSRVGALPQPKYVTTPTKGLMILSPRNLHSPGYKSSKKCLISEMSKEPRPVSRDCIYPALVGCSTPVEAVLPQISSNMWSRGFGQLVRARNIKTVGDLSALTPSEVKTLPIRSPKLSNVKKALKSYEQQRKGRGSDELKSFDETEMLTSEAEETSPPQNQDEDKMPAETLATELLDEPVPADVQQMPETSADRAQGELLSEVEVLTGRMTPERLGRYTPQQLGRMYDHLGGMMRCVVMELQTRLCQTDEP